MQKSFLGGLSCRGVDFMYLSSDLFRFCYSNPFVLVPYHRYYNSFASELWFLRNMMGFRLSKRSLICFGEALRWTGKYKGNFSRETGFLPPMHIWMDSVISLFWSLIPLSVGEYWLQSKPICSKQLLPLHSRLPWLSLPEGIFSIIICSVTPMCQTVLTCGGVKMKERGSWPHRAYGATQGAQRYQATKIGGWVCLPFSSHCDLYGLLQQGDTRHNHLFVQMVTHCKILVGRDCTFLPPSLPSSYLA